MKRDLLTTAEVGRLVGLTPAGVRRAAIVGQLSVAIRTASGLRLFSPDAVQQFRAERDERRAAAAGKADAVRGTR